MIGLIVQLIVSGILIWIFERKTLSVLGFRPTLHRVTQFLFFFFLAFFFCTLGFVLKMYIGSQVWKVNPNLNLQLIWDGVWWNLRSVLFEEFIFRGVILYILMKRVGAHKAILASAIAFGIYHWFSFGVIGNPIQMIFVFVMTGLMGLLLAYGYAKTLSLYLPIGIHFGWNLTQIFIFSQGPTGDGIFINPGTSDFRTDSYIIWITVAFLPLLFLFLISYLCISRIESKNTGVL